MSVSSSAPSAHTSPSSWGLNDRLISLMESVYSIIAGLGLRYVVDTVSRHDFKITGTLVGLWEGVILIHFLKKLPKSTDPYLAFAVRLFIDFLVTESVSRLVLVLTWTGMGMILADVAPAIWEDIGLRRVWRRFRRDLYIISESVPTVVFFPPTRTVRFSPSREPSVIAEAEEEEEEEPNADARTEARSVESSTSAGLTELDTPANIEPPIRRRLPGYFPGMLSDTESVLSSVLSHDIHLPSTIQRDTERTSRRLSVYPITTLDHDLASETSSQRNEEDEIKLSSSSSSQSTVTGPADTTRFTDDLRITEDFDTTQLTDIPDEVIEEQKPAATTEKEKDHQQPEVDTGLGLKPPNVPFFLPPTPSDSQPPQRRRLPRDDQPRPSSASIPQIPDMPEFPSDGPSDEWEKIQKEDANDAEHPWEQVQREDAVDVDGPPPLPPKDWLDMSHLEPFLATTSTNTYDRAGLGDTTTATNDDEHRNSQPPPYFDHVDDHEDIYEDHPSDVKVSAAVAGGSPAPGLADLSTLSNRHIDEMRITNWLEQDAARRRLEEEEAEQRRKDAEEERRRREQEKAEAEAQKLKEEEEAAAAEKRRNVEEAERILREKKEAERIHREKEEAEQKRKEEEAAEQRRKDEEAEIKRLEKKAAAEQQRKEEEKKRQKEAAEQRLRDEEAKKKKLQEEEEEAERKRKEDEAAETKRLEELEKKRIEEEKKRQDEAAEQQRRDQERLKEEEEEKRKGEEAAEQQRKEAERLEQEKRNEEAEKKRKEHEESERVRLEELEKERIEEAAAETRRQEEAAEERRKEQEIENEKMRKEEAEKRRDEEAKNSEQEEKQKEEETAGTNRLEEEEAAQIRRRETTAEEKSKEQEAAEIRKSEEKPHSEEEEKNQQAELQSSRQAEIGPTTPTGADGQQSTKTVDEEMQVKDEGNDEASSEQHRMETESVATDQSAIPADIESRLSRLLLTKGQIVEIQSRINELGAQLDGADEEGSANHDLQRAQKVLEKLKRKEQRRKDEATPQSEPGLNDRDDYISFDTYSQDQATTRLLEKLEELLSPQATSLFLTVDCGPKRVQRYQKQAITDVLVKFKLLDQSVAKGRQTIINVPPEDFSAWVTEYRASVTQSDDV